MRDVGSNEAAESLNSPFNSAFALITERQAASLLSVSPRALQKWRANGRGPPFVRISNRCIRYRKSDLFDWAADRLRKSTSDHGQYSKSQPNRV